MSYNYPCCFVAFAANAKFERGISNLSNWRLGWGDYIAGKFIFPAMSRSNHHTTIAGCSSRMARVRSASDTSQGSPLLKTCFQRCGDGVAERDRGLGP
jgi:hypothetical protein